jgi:hypothetical protein
LPSNRLWQFGQTNAISFPSEVTLVELVTVQDTL